MHLVESGILFQEHPLVRIGFYRHNEALNEEKTKKIFSGIFGMISEIFNDRLQILEFGKYTTFFFAFHMAGKVPTEDLFSRWILIYSILDLESKKLSRELKKIIRSSMEKLSKSFKIFYEHHDIQNLVDTNHDFKPFMNEIIAIFKDLALPPEERFNSIWGNRQQPTG
ncbi:MAG: hypothetical protein ACTSUE_22170 [Promethearchaeota archaeon]